MTVLLLILLVFCLPRALLLAGGQEKKRGCGRGCATCGNRNICHRGEYKEKQP